MKFEPFLDLNGEQAMDHMFDQLDEDEDIDDGFEPYITDEDLIEFSKIRLGIQREVERRIKDQQFKKRIGMNEIKEVA